MRAGLRVAFSLLAGAACSPTDWVVPEDAEPSEGCDGEEPVETISRETLQIDGAERVYTVRFPGSYRADFPFPLVFALHGAGSNGTEFRELVALEEAARARAVFVYPTALEDTDGLTRWDHSPQGPDFALREAIEQSLAERYCIDQARVFAVGFSNGAAFTHELACAGVVDGFGAVSGGGPDDSPCAGARPGVIVHGTVDPVVPISYGEASREAWREQNGCRDTLDTIEPAPCQAYAACDVPLHWCEHDTPVQIAHDWPKWTDEAIWDVLGAI